MDAVHNAWESQFLLRDPSYFYQLSAKYSNMKTNFATVSKMSRVHYFLLIVTNSSSSFTSLFTQFLFYPCYQLNLSLTQPNLLQWTMEFTWLPEASLPCRPVPTYWISFILLQVCSSYNIFRLQNCTFKISSSMPQLYPQKQELQKPICNFSERRKLFSFLTAHKQLQ